MRPSLCLALSLTVVCLLGGCSIVYRLPTRQGNVIEQPKLNQLHLGMTQKQVRYLLGTPIASSPYTPDRWDYYGYYKSPHGSTSSRDVSLFFNKKGVLTKMQGVHDQTGDVAPTAPDKAKLAQEKARSSQQARPGHRPPPHTGSTPASPSGVQ